MKKIFFVSLVIITLFFAFCLVYTAQEITSLKKEFVRTIEETVERIPRVINLSEKINEYFHSTEEDSLESVKFYNRILIVIIDSLLAGACLWLTLFVLAGLNSFYLKKYLNFLLIFNLCWVFFIVFFQLLWQIADYLVIKLEPTLAEEVSVYFLRAIIISEFVLFVWILARIFSLKFLPALIICFVSHFLYCIAVFLFFSFAPVQKNAIHFYAKENLGLKLLVRNYLNDMDAVTTAKGLASIIKFRPFHL